MVSVSIDGKTISRSVKDESVVSIKKTKLKTKTKISSKNKTKCLFIIYSRLKSDEALMLFLWLDNY